MSGTRVDILQKVHLWVKSKQPLLFWMSGMAGTGKSTIAQSVAEAYDQNGSLCASFFFSRDQQARRETRLLFQTIAFQLGCAYPALKLQIAKALEDPTVLNSTLKRQLRQLILDPISEISDTFSSPVVVVLDALDECEEEDAISRIIRLLAEELKSLSIPLKFFVTSRPEAHIRTTFASPKISSGTQALILHEVKLADVQNDIQTYVKHELGQIAEECRDILKHDPWPRDDEVETLVQMSSGLFVAGATAVKFVRPVRQSRDPRPRLTMILHTARQLRLRIKIFGCLHSVGRHIQPNSRARNER